MAKSKKQLKKNIRKNKLIVTKSFKLGLIVLLFLLPVYYIYSISTKPVVNKNLGLEQKIVISTYPSLTATPSPAPLMGYCLKVPVLTYHHIQPQADAIEKEETSLSVDDKYFDGQMAYLQQKGYMPLFANELIDALLNHTPLPSKPVLITMDDGYADNYTYALSILRKYNLKANLMLATGLVNSNPSMLNWDQVREMKSSGLIYLTNHTWSHASIMRIAKDKVDNEIDTARNQIEQNTGQSVNIFTYPYGEFNQGNIQTLKNKGYSGAFSTIPGFYQCDSFIMTLHRTHIGNALLSAYGL